MSNETKRDVLNEAVNELEDVLPDTALFGSEYIADMVGELRARYTAALPDDLPVIPKAVGEILRSAHGQDNLLGVLETAKNGHKISEALAWIIANQNIFARAWLDGYQVEEAD